MGDDRIRYVTRRLIWLPIFIFLVLTIVFFIGRLGPGDAALISVHPGASSENIERIRHELGLDKPLVLQYADYLKNLLRGDLGESWVRPGKKVIDLIVERIPVSAPLGFSSLIIALFLGVAVGLVASLRRGTWIDNTLIGGFLFFSSVPHLIFVQFLIFLLSLKLHLLPAKWSGGWESIFTSQAIIPILALSLPAVAGIARLTRTMTLNVMDEKYVTFARAKGLPTFVVATKYILRNSLLPLSTAVILSLFTIISGSFFTEFLYGIPGTGQFMVQSLFQRDYPVIMGWMMIISVLFVAGNLVDDLSKKFIDPRVEITKLKK